VYLNQWLVEAGYLDISDRTKGLRSIRETSSAFCLDPSRIYIHRSGKYPKGSVRNAEYQELRDELALKLTSLSFNGERVVQKVYRKEEIFRGPFAEKGPDLYVLPNYGFDLKGAINREIVFGTTHFRGMHTYDDAHLFISENHDDRSFMIEEIAGMVRNFLGN
jgi:predicted AlkP superfamily phosphohydrolase/phosphomutase